MSPGPAGLGCPPFFLMTFPCLRRFIRPVCLLLLLGGLSGCVLVRLLELRHQLAEFDQYFTVDSSNGVRIECREPLVEVEDARALGIRPETVRHSGTAEQWRMRWIKEMPPGVKEAATYDIAFEAMFVDEKLTRISIEERFFAFFPKPLFLKLLRSAGTAEINREKRRAEITAALQSGAYASSLPTAATIGKMLGLPTERNTAGGVITCRYRYQPVTTATPRPRSVSILFTFDGASGRLTALDAKLSAGTIHFNLSPPPADK